MSAATIVGLGTRLANYLGGGGAWKKNTEGIGDKIIMINFPLVGKSYITFKKKTFTYANIERDYATRRMG